MRALAAAVVILCVTAAWPPTAALGQAPPLPTGRIVDPVGEGDASYALYLPTDYWGEPRPLLIGFHPDARGRAIVETYQDAAERYGWIVAASNVSKNGPWAVSSRAVTAMTADLSRRFPVAAGRFYLTGLSGGARVALQVAMASGRIDGVIASSAGFPDSQPRRSVPFAVFGTAGTEDFNYVEMRVLGHELKSAHAVRIFPGGHQLPPAAVAREAVEWLEIHAMAAGTRPRDPILIDELFQRRMAAADARTAAAEQAEALDAVAREFAPLRDVTAVRARATAALADKAVKKALADARGRDYAEARDLNALIELEAGLRTPETRHESFWQLPDRLTRLRATATEEADSPARQQARRVLRAVTAGGLDRTDDAEYRRLLESVRLPGGRGGGA